MHTSHQKSCGRRHLKRKRKVFISRVTHCFLCLLCGALLVLWHSGAPFDRAFPRLLREIQRNLVHWDAKLVDARSRPVFSTGLLHNFVVSVISLERSRSRRAKLIHELTAAGIAHEIFYATDGLREFQAEDISKYAGKGKKSKLRFEHRPDLNERARRFATPDLVLHERLRFGCYLSHVRLWEQLVDSAEQLAVILEDDVSIVDGFNSSLQYLLGSLPDDWDILYLNSCHAKFGGLLRPGIRQLKGALCTYGYALSVRGAKKLLHGTALLSEKPVDHMLDEAIYSALLSAYHVSPPLVFPRVTESTLAYPKQLYMS